MRRFLIGAACALVLSVTAGRASADLVTNGGFETGDFTGWTLNADPGVNFVDGGFVHSGDFAAWFGELGQLGTLSQALATTAGTEYKLTFWFAGDGDDPSAFQALVDGTVLLDLVNPPFDFDYVQYTFNFTAASDSTLLSFKFRDDPFFINLDDVSVVANSRSVPEPSSLAMIGLGGFGLIGLARRRMARRSK